MALRENLFQRSVAYRRDERIGVNKLSFACHLPK
jgi:hypothetical protein